MNEMSLASDKTKGLQTDENHVFELALLAIVLTQVYKCKLDTTRSSHSLENELSNHLFSLYL